MSEKSNIRPLVSVYIPVYNGSKLIGRSIESILAQTYDNIELLICDNASTDNTAEICKEYALKDSRIKFYQNETNIGVFNNGNKLMSLVKGEYCFGQSHDDVRHPDFIKKCLEKLLASPNAIVCMSDLIEVSVNGDEKYISLESRLGSTSQRVISWFEQITVHDTYFQFGLYRVKDLNKIGSVPDIMCADWIMLVKQLLAGEFVVVNEPLFYFYVHHKPCSEFEYWLPHQKNTPPIRVYTTIFQNIFNAIKDSEQLTVSEKNMVFQEAIKSMVISAIAYNYGAYCHILMENMGGIIGRQFQYSGSFYGEALFKTLEIIFSKVLNVPLDNQDADLKDKSLHEVYEACLRKYNNESNEKRPIFIWGAGREADAVKMFKKFNYKVKGIISTDPNRQGKLLNDVKTYSLSKIFNWQGSERPFIVIASQEDAAIAIQEDLEKNGYIKGRDFGSYNFFRRFNLSVIGEIWLKMITFLERSDMGKEVLNKMVILKNKSGSCRRKMKVHLQKQS